MLYIQELEKEIKRGLLKLIYFCYTTEPFFISEVSKLIRKNFPSISIETYESAEDIDMTALMSANSLFVDKRILLIYGFEKIKKTEKKIEWLKKVVNTPSTSVSLVILCNASNKDLSDEITFLKKEKNCLIFNLDIPERDLSEWINYKASQHGINLKADAINYLINVTGGQPGLISSEIEKIALLTESKSVGLFEIKDVLTELGEFTAFDLIDAIRKKDRQKAFSILEKLRNVEPDMILGALNWYYTNKTEAGEKVYSLLYRANLALRQARSLSLDMLVYELMKD